MPEGDWQRAQRDLQQQAATIFSLRKDLRQAEALRTRVGGGGAQPWACCPPGHCWWGGASRGLELTSSPPGGAVGGGASWRLLQSAEEKEMFELQCLALRRDSKMYKDRIEAILRQMEEVAIERDQVGTHWPAWTHQPFWGGSRQGSLDKL